MLDSLLLSCVGRGLQTPSSTITQRPSPQSSQSGESESPVGIAGKSQRESKPSTFI